jgi:hypothetical protein
VLVAAVERVGETAIELAVLVEHGVEQEHRHLVSLHAVHRVPPGRHVNRAPLDGDRAARVHALEHVLGAPLDRRLALMPMLVEVLLEVPLPVKQRDGDERDAKIRCGAEGIAGEDAEATAVRRDRLLEADLHREVRNSGARDTKRHEFLDLCRNRGRPPPRYAGSGMAP